MLIYKAEQDLGLDNCVISYATALEDWKPDVDQVTKVQEYMGHQLKASINDEGLVYKKSLLVSTVWNKNDDVFAPMPTWEARHTPSHKPTNIEHDEHKLVGHMTDSWVIDKDHNLIADTTTPDDLPELFHIVTGSVIYTIWEDPILQERIQKLLADIKDGKKYVSMECIFSDFDYILQNPNNANDLKTIARNKETSHMTRALRAYGGDGMYDGWKIGRLLKKFTFSGKGYVDKPANPESIIFADAQIINFNKATIENPFISNNGVYLNDVSSFAKGERNMSENNVYKEQNEELKAKLASLTTELDSLKHELASANTKELEQQVAALTEEKKALETQLQSANEQIEAAQTKVNDLEKEVKEAKDAVKASEDELNKIKAQEIHTRRVSLLVGKGIEQDKADGIVDKFDTLNDDAFAELADTYAQAAKASTSAASTDDDADDSTDNDVVDDTATANDPTPAMASDPTSDEDEKKAKRCADLRKVVAGFLHRDRKISDEGED